VVVISDRLPEIGVIAGIVSRKKVPEMGMGMSAIILIRDWHESQPFFHLVEEGCRVKI
jgi:hypothetical protein